jgi:nitronate monooxygenase
MLALGADGAVFGTRFLLTPESLYSETQKSLLLRASPGGTSSTVRTSAIDRARASGWPQWIDGRALRVAAVDEYEQGHISLDELGKELKAGAETDDPDRLVVWAGTGVDFMTTVNPAQVSLPPKKASLAWNGVWGVGPPSDISDC